MRSNILALIALYIFIITGCNTITTEVISDDVYYSNDEIAVVGYLSNMGVVVNVQKTRSPLYSGEDSCIVANAEVELFTADNELAVILQKLDDYNFVTPKTFRAVIDKEYYIQVSAPGFSKVTSLPQKVKVLPEIDSVSLIIEEKNFWLEDPTVYQLFGQPRSIWLSYYIGNEGHEIQNSLSRLIYGYRSKKYQYESGKYKVYTQPDFFINLGSGVSQFTSVPDVINQKFYFYDQITTDSTIVHKDSIWNVIDRIEKVKIQSFSFSSDMVSFFESVNEYLENRSDPFSIMAKKIPSNMSNGIGYFGSAFIAEKELIIPEVKNGTILY